MSDIDRDVEYLEVRLAELKTALENCPSWKCGTQWWLDRLDMCTAIQRQLDRLERESGVQ